MPNPDVFPRDADRYPEINVITERKVVRLPDGRVVERTKFNTGNVLEVMVFPGDYPDAPLVKS